VFIIGVDAALPILTELPDNRLSSPFHPSPLVAALRRQKAPALWWRLSVAPARNTVLIDVLEEDPSLDLWDQPAEIAKKIAMMHDINLAKVEAATQ
jgi:hypothetical protein